mmetsp:Transcript_16373/g.19362  ORF Transcript_16373/g.19362 Transcript_16373/m.19362 type:complete len:1227 (+) Transcript_16373:88-3768(+)
MLADRVVSGAEYYTTKDTLDDDDDEDYEKDDDALKKYPLGEKRCHSALSLFTAPTQSRKDLLIEENIVQEDGNSDSDDDGADILSPVMVSSPHFFPRSDSMRKSMEEYEIRREDVENKIKQGVVQQHHISESKMPEDIRMQANLDMYTKEKQLMRSKIKRSPAFCKEILSLWTLVGQKEGKINKEHYFEMMKNFSLLIVPPPYDEKETMKTVLKDWKRDLEYDKKQNFLQDDENDDNNNNTVTSTKKDNKNQNDDENEYLNYEGFFQSIYELVDIWTETAEENEYVEMVHRLISGVTILQKNGKLIWKNNIEFDNFFSFIGHDKNDENKRNVITIDGRNKGKKGIRSSVAFLPTYYVDSTMEEVINEENKTTYTLQPMSAKKINLIIAQIYRGKQTADKFANSRDKFKPIRFDKFVLRFYMVQFGTRGVARRHLRHFTSSALSYALSEGGKQEYPRIYLFCILLGIIIVSPAVEFNPRISAEYFQPSLRSIFPNPRIIEDLLYDGTGDGVLVMKQCIEKAVIPISLNYSLGGSFAINSFKKQLNDMCLENRLNETANASVMSSTSTSLGSFSSSFASNGGGGSSKKNYMVNFDECMLLALDMWIFSDSLRLVRERAAMQTFKRFLDRYSERKKQERLEGRGRGDEGGKGKGDNDEGDDGKGSGSLLFSKEISASLSGPSDKKGKNKNSSSSIDRGSIDKGSIDKGGSSGRRRSSTNKVKTNKRNSITNRKNSMSKNNNSKSMKEKENNKDEEKRINQTTETVSSSSSSIKKKNEEEEGKEEDDENDEGISFSAGTFDLSGAVDVIEVPEAIKEESLEDMLSPAPKHTPPSMLLNQDSQPSILPPTQPVPHSTTNQPLMSLKQSSEDSTITNQFQAPQIDQLSTSLQSNDSTRPTSAPFNDNTRQANKSSNTTHILPLSSPTRGVKQNLLPELKHEGGGGGGFNGARPSTAPSPLKTMFRQYSQESFATADLLKSRQQIANGSDHGSVNGGVNGSVNRVISPSTPTSSLLQRNAQMNRLPHQLLNAPSFDPNIKGGNNSVGLGLASPSTHYKSIFSPKRDHHHIQHQHLLPLDIPMRSTSGGATDHSSQNINQFVNSLNPNNHSNNMMTHNNMINHGGGGHFLEDRRHSGSSYGSDVRRMSAQEIHNMSSLGVKKVSVVRDENPICDEDVYEFIKTLNLEKYAPIFATEEIDMECLILMSEEDLKELDIKKGARFKILKATKALQNQ